MFDKNAEIVEVPDDNSILNVGYTFIPIKEVAQIAGNQYIDVCGIVRDIGALSKITVKSGESKSKRVISICDDSNSSIDVCLWTEQAEMFNSLMCGTVMVCKGARLVDF